MRQAQFDLGSKTMGVKNPELDLRLLRSFVVVAEELHFTRAAERLGIAQPPLSQQIRRIEDKVGYALFLRGTRSVELTQAGRSLLVTARRLFDQASFGIEAARRAGRGEIGRLRIGFPTSIALTVLPTIIRSYRVNYPDVDLELRELATTPQHEALEAGSIDIGFLREARSDEAIASETIFTESFVAVLPHDHPLTKKRQISITSLAREKFILFPRSIGPEFHDRITGLCRDAGFEPRVTQEASEWHTIAALVEAGLGISLAPASINRLHLDHVVYKPIAKSSARTAVVMCWRRDGTEPPLDRFLETARRFRTKLTS
jgi:DNA-binding transcriptional LysR family regulator